LISRQISPSHSIVVFIPAGIVVHAPADRSPPENNVLHLDATRAPTSSTVGPSIAADAAKLAASESEKSGHQGRAALVMAPRETGRPMQRNDRFTGSSRSHKKRVLVP